MINSPEDPQFIPLTDTEPIPTNKLQFGHSRPGLDLNVENLHFAAEKVLGSYAAALALTSKDTIITRLIEENKQLEILNKIDPLTGIGNRRLLHETYIGLTSEHPSQRDDELGLPLDDSHSVLMIDLDHFKLVNDRFGHDVGDQVLKKVSSTLLGSIRGNDVIGRLGGEEFAAILPRTGLNDAELVAEKVRDRISALEFDQSDLRVTVSIGVGPLMRADSLQAGIKSADQAVYSAKHNGRNQVVRSDQLPELL